MSSFYGGKQGRTYHIVQRYDSVEQMVNAFSDGGAYTGANYGQYVIIDTVLSQGRSSSMENGLLYRRGFDYNNPYTPPPEKLPPAQETDEEFQQRWAEWVKNPGGGAIYVGQIVGPEGRTPEVSLEQWSTFLTQQANTGNFGSKSSVIVNNYSSGKTDDEIQVGYINIKDQHGDVEGAYLAVNIPKLVMESEVVNHGAYATAGVVETPASTSHPHWYKWDFTIPDGKHGRDFSSLTLEDGNQTLAEKDSEGQDIVSGDKYLTYSITDYENGSGYTPTPSSTYHLGRWPYRVIDNISQDENLRTFFVWQTGATVEEGILYYVGDVENSEENLIYVAICIKPGAVGTIPNFTQDLGQTFQSGETQWLVTTLPETAPAHITRIDYKAGPDDTLETHQVDYIFVDGTGKMFVVYAGSSVAHFLTQFYTIKDISSDAGWVTINYINEGKQSDRFNVPQNLNIIYNDDYSYFTIDYWEAGEHKGVDQRTYLKQVTNITLNNQNNIYQEQRFIATYKGVEGESQYVTENISDPINQVLAVGRQGDNILVLYSDPNFRASIDAEHKVIVPSWTDPISNRTYTNLEWYNFGPLGAQYHVQGEYTYADIKPGGDLENGFTGDLEDRAGWLITVTDNNQDRHIYAYDYNGGTYTIGEPGDTFTSHWYELLDITAASIDPALSVRVSSTQPTSLLLDNMLWFVESYGHDHYNSTYNHFPTIV